MKRTTKGTRETHARRAAAIPLVVAAVLVTTPALFGHDFWLVPDAFAIAGDSTLRISGQSGTRFATSQSAVQPTRVVDARIVGPSLQTRITDLSVQGTSLRLSQKPAADGQYLVVVGLAPRTTRATPAGLLRFLRAEGGADEAARLEGENALAGRDSVVYHSASYATTIVQVGRAGPRAFNVSTGHPLQFIPLTDPAGVHVGDMLHVRIVGNDKPLINTGVYAGAAIDTTVRAADGTVAVPPTLHLVTDANGVVHIPLSKAGPWNIRAAHVSPRAGASAGEWDVARATYVFSVAASQ